MSRLRPTQVTLFILTLTLLIGASAQAQDVASQLREWLVQAERDNGVNPLITFSSVAATPQRYNVTKAVRISGWVRDVVPAEDARYVYASVSTDCGSAVALHTWLHSMLVPGMRVRAVVPAPLQGLPSEPIIALAWAPESTFGGFQGGGLAPTGTEGLRVPQPGFDPNVATGARTIRGNPGGGSTNYGIDQSTGLAFYGAPRTQQQQQPAYTGQGWSHGGGVGYTAPQPTYTTDEAAQFAAYCNLARYFNSSLTEGETRAIVSALFEACGVYGVPRPLMAALIYAESCYKPLCESHVGAMGLTQLMPGTARGLGVTSPYEVRQNVHGGTKYLAEMLQRYQSRGWATQVRFALAAYNSGPGTVDRVGGIPQNSETPPYVNKIVRTYAELCEKGYR